MTCRACFANGVSDRFPRFRQPESGLGSDSEAFWTGFHRPADLRFAFPGARHRLCHDIFATWTGVRWGELLASEAGPAKTPFQLDGPTASPPTPLTGRPAAGLS